MRLLNIFAEKVYIGKYDFDLGANKLEERLRKGDLIPEPHLRAVRLSRGLEQGCSHRPSDSATSSHKFICAF